MVTGASGLQRTAWVLNDRGDLKGIGLLQGKWKSGRFPLLIGDLPRCLARTVIAHLPEWHTGEQAPVLSPERFTRQLLRKKAMPSSGQRPTLTALWRQIATKLGVLPNVMRFGGRRAVVVEARDSFIRQAVGKAGYQATEVATFRGCHPSKFTRTLR